ncbi:hypothetical protein ALP98_102903 [Pseudomonas viridiflava]|uniref:Uncharacterized protein n=3 Tax=Pseudomonas syringae group TaxID=136849 RepID=A0A3M4IR21_PSEVI|nr:hypothetical protein ALQ30_102309 [Pseudomonas syringae pv. persicae]RMP81179.1 hypothetical protein ALQ15_115458 [Pseudomonas syringae pv. actinidiae]RMQ06745.1 hypothetical protein ALQ09_102027 [Pseudomonas viridiflava]RMQ71625.1 hypothetical protein ALP98_102903 [Pseudomonas viridiflava]
MKRFIGVKKVQFLVKEKYIDHKCTDIWKSGLPVKFRTKKSPRWGSGLKDSHLGAALQ